MSLTDSPFATSNVINPVALKLAQAIKKNEQFSRKNGGLVNNALHAKMLEAYNDWCGQGKPI